MRKTTKQAIINVALASLFAIFLIVYGTIIPTVIPLSDIWFGVFLLLIAVLCMSKFILYHRQNFLFFGLVFLIDAVIILTIVRIFEILMTRLLGVFILVPAGVLALFYLKYREIYQRNFSIILGVVGSLLLVFFN